jgi:SSS family solute:Na+ symporter
MASRPSVPIFVALYWDKSSGIGAIGAMLFGGGTTVCLEVFVDKLPAGLDANVFGISVSAITFIALSLLFPDDQETNKPVEEEDHTPD